MQPVPPQISDRYPEVFHKKRVQILVSEKVDRYVVKPRHLIARRLPERKLFRVVIRASWIRPVLCVIHVIGQKDAEIHVARVGIIRGEQPLDRGKEHKLLQGQIFYLYIGIIAKRIEKLRQKLVERCTVKRLAVRQGDVLHRRPYGGQPRQPRFVHREHPVALAVTVVVLALVYVFREELRGTIAELFGETGLIGVWTRTTAEYFLYAFTMIILMPVAEGLFFRKALISFHDKSITTVTVVLSLVLNVLLHVNAPSGAPILLASALPLAVLYLITKNVHLTILMHMLYCLPLYLKYVIYAIGRFAYR